MTVLASECQGISGNFDALASAILLLPAAAMFTFFVWLIMDDCEGLLILLSAFRAIGRALRPVCRALRWLFDRFSLGVAWFFVCTAVWLSFVTFLVGWNGFPVPPLDCWPVPVLCFVSWNLERLYQWERDSDTSYKAFLLRILRGNGVNL